MKNLFSIALLTVALAISGCASLPQTAGQIGQSLSTASPKQAATLADALQLATIATDAATVYVQTAKPSQAIKDEMSRLNEQVHTVLANLQAANARGESLTFAVFNEAYAAFMAYAASKGATP